MARNHDVEAISGLLRGGGETENTAVGALRKIVAEEKSRAGIAIRRRARRMLDRPSGSRTAESVAAARVARLTREAANNWDKMRRRNSGNRLRDLVRANDRYFAGVIECGGSIPREVTVILDGPASPFSSPTPSPGPAAPSRCGKLMPRAKVRCARPGRHRVPCARR